MANEKRLIDANDVYSLFDKNGFARLHVADIDTIPRVDAVEVVRCKDCKSWDSETGFCDKHSKFYHGVLDWDVFNDDDFCSQGERKDGDGNG